MLNITTKQNILVVEDDTKIHKGICRLFKQQQVPWEYTFATGVNEALAVMEEIEVDGVISDIKMPGRDGFELLGHLRSTSRWKDLPIVMLTGLDNPGLKSKALDLGATDLLNKPINPDELLARIRSLLYIKKCQDTIKAQNSYLEQLVHQRTEALEATRLDIILRLAKASEFRSEETGNHVIRVGYYSKILAEALGSTTEFCEMIFLTSPLHDLGKIGIPDHILLKKSPLDYAEWKIMKTHCHIGQDLLAQKSLMQNSTLNPNEKSILEVLNQDANPFLLVASEIAGFHHEQWQGNGYPFGVNNEAIPLAARIVTIADVYDALRSKRTYKTEMSHEDALVLMHSENGIRFDPYVFNAFEQSLATFMEIHHTYSDITNTSCKS
jgi:response regulator RpfG family c-di-GMP phosphodiesterase